MVTSWTRPAKCGGASAVCNSMVWDLMHVGFSNGKSPRDRIVDSGHDGFQRIETWIL